MFTWAEEAIPEVVFVADTDVAILVVETVCIMVAIVTTRAAIIGAIAIPYAEVFLLINTVILEMLFSVVQPVTLTSNNVQYFYSLPFPLQRLYF